MHRQNIIGAAKLAHLQQHRSQLQLRKYY